MSLIAVAIFVLGGIGIVSAILLYVAAKKFAVPENPLIAQVQEVLPAANCGGCGYPGCAAFATACVNAPSLDTLLCPVGGAEVMGKIAAILGKQSTAADPMIAVVRCNGDCRARPHTNRYDGARTCAIAAALYGGETACAFGCIGFGDCVKACTFGAIQIHPDTGLPIVSDDLCTACGACVKACPKRLIELRKKGPKSRRIFVCCMNKDKGVTARKACANACIGCSKCAKECSFEAITVADNLAYIDFHKCRLCRKCADACPTHAIHAANFPPPKDAATSPA